MGGNSDIGVAALFLCVDAWGVYWWILLEGVCPAKKCLYLAENLPSPRSKITGTAEKSINLTNICKNKTNIYINIISICTNISLIYSF
jgi:hypothetical protein